MHTVLSPPLTKCWSSQKHIRGKHNRGRSVCTCTCVYNRQHCSLHTTAVKCTARLLKAQWNLSHSRHSPPYPHKQQRAAAQGFMRHIGDPHPRGCHESTYNTSDWCASIVNVSHWTLTTLVSITITATQPLNRRFMVHATGSLQNPWTSNGRIPNPEILAPSCTIHCFIYNLWGKMISHGRRAISKRTAVPHRFKEDVCGPAKKCLLRNNNDYFHVFGWMSSIFVSLEAYSPSLKNMVL